MTGQTSSVSTPFWQKPRGLAWLSLLVAALFAAVVWLFDKPQIVAGIEVPKSYEGIRGTWFAERIAEIDAMQPAPGGIAFFGDSLTYNGDWDALLPDVQVLNFGIKGDRTDGMINRLPQLIEAEPAFVSLLLGTNDLEYGRSPRQVARRFERIATDIQTALPKAKIVAFAVIPREAGYAEDVAQLADLYAETGARTGIKVINMNDALEDDTGALAEVYTTDGLHLSEAGYELWAGELNSVLSEFERDIAQLEAR